MTIGRDTIDLVVNDVSIPNADTHLNDFLRGAPLARRRKQEAE